MDTEDMKRELEKIKDALEWASTHHEKQSEANAALHGSTKVMYTPLASKLSNALMSVERVLEEF